MDKISHSGHPHNKEIVSTPNAEDLRPYFNSDWTGKHLSVAQVALDFISEKKYSLIKEEQLRLSYEKQLVAREQLSSKRSRSEETEASVSRQEERPRRENSLSSSKLDHPSKTENKPDMRNLEYPKKLEPLKLIMKYHQNIYQRLYNEFNESKPFSTVKKARERWNKLDNLKNRLNKFKASLESIRSSAELQDACIKLRTEIHRLKKDIYNTSMNHQLNFAFNHDHFEYYESLSGDNALAKQMAEIKKTPLYEDLKNARLEFEKSYRFEKSHKKKFKHSFNDKLFSTYEAYSTLIEKVRKELHTKEVDQALIQQGKDMLEKVEKQLAKRREGGMTEELIDLSYRLFYRPVIEKLQRSSEKSETFDPLMKWGVIKGDVNNHYSVMIAPSLPDRLYFEMGSFPLKVAVDPTQGYIVNHLADRVTDQKWRDKHLPKNFSNATWSEYLKGNRYMKNNAWFEHIKDILASKDEFPERTSLGALITSIEKLPGAQQSCELKYLKNLLDPERYILEETSGKILFNSIEETLEIKREGWYKLALEDLELKKGIPEELSPENRDQYTNKLADLKRGLSEETSREDTEKPFSLLKETWLKHIEDNLKIGENLAKRGATREEMLKYIKKHLNEFEKCIKEILKFKWDLQQNNISKANLLEFVKKTSELKKPFPGELSQEAWDQYIKKKGLEYDELPVDFFKPLHASELTRFAEEEVAKLYKVETGQTAAPLSQLIGVDFTYPQTVEILHGLGEPGEKKLYTREDNPDEFYRLKATHYGRRVDLLMADNPEEYKGKQNRRAELFVTPSGEKCIIDYIDQTPDTE